MPLRDPPLRLLGGHRLLVELHRDPLVVVCGPRAGCSCGVRATLDLGHRAERHGVRRRGAGSAGRRGRRARAARPRAGRRSSRPRRVGPWKRRSCRPRKANADGVGDAPAASTPRRAGRARGRSARGPPCWPSQRRPPDLLDVRRGRAAAPRPRSASSSRYSGSSPCSATETMRRPCAAAVAPLSRSPISSLTPAITGRPSLELSAQALDRALGGLVRAAGRPGSSAMPRSLYQE